MTEDILKAVGEKVQSKELSDLTQRCKDLVQLSRNEMKKNYDKWDYYDQVYRGERKPDLQDVKARQRGEPEKIIIPLTFGQVQTFVAFGWGIYNQRDYFYEMIASGAEDEAPSKMATAILEQNLTKNKFRATKLIQFLTDIARFSLGITKESWIHDQCPVMQQIPDPKFQGQMRTDLPQPVQVPMINQVTMKTKYLGNKILNVSPYRWFPDVRLPLTRWNEGEFCADEIEESKQSLEKMEQSGTIAGLENVPDLPTEAYGDRKLSFMKTGIPLGSPGNVPPNYYLITEIQLRLNPSKTFYADGKPLNPDMDYDQIWIVWIANDDRIVRLEEAGYDHEEFGYNCAQFLDDQNRFINFSLADVLSACQDTATWFLNSRITSVRKSIFNQLVVDPSGIEVDDIIKRSPMIRMKQGRAGSGVANWIMQLPVQDVTQGHLTDVANLTAMAKEASGITESLLGQFSSGRRSAKEAGNVASAAANRLLMIFASVWESGLSPMGSKMLSNLRQGLDEETLVQVYGQVNTLEATTPEVPGQPPPLFRLVPMDKSSLVGNYDFSVFNGTLPSQRQATAMVLKDVLDTLQKDPRMVLVTGMDPQLLFYEMLTLMNVRNVQRFRLTPERLQQLVGLAQATGNAGGLGGPKGGGGQPQPGAAPARPQAGTRPPAR